MKRGKYEAPRAPMSRNTKKALTILLSLVLVLGCAIGGTLAWLQATTDPVTNTFTVGDISLTLVESPYDAENNTYGTPAANVENNYPLIPGNSYKKDPVVTVTAKSEACYLFVKVEQINNPATYLNYDLNLDAWTKLAGVDGVYYLEVAKSDDDQSWHLLTGDTIAVNENIVKPGTNTAGTNYVAMPTAGNEPKLIFTAYAVQQANRTVEQAWDLVDGN